MGFFSRYKKTNFRAGGLILEPISDSAPRLKTEIQFVAPRKIDFRDMCLPSNDQGQFPHCAGYATAGYIEVQNWRIKHYPEQLDGSAIYFAAKAVEGRQGDGTTLQCAIQGAINLGLVSGKGIIVNKSINDVKFAIHQYGVVVAGFMITDDWNYVEKNTGIIRDSGGKAVIRGGHAVLLCGLDSIGFYIQNSWGFNWGIDGFATLRYNQAEKQLMQAMIIV